MFPVKRPSHSWNPAHGVTYNRAPAEDEVALCCPTCGAVVWLAAPQTEVYQGKASSLGQRLQRLGGEAVLQGVVALFVTGLLLAIAATVSEAKSGTELGARGSQWSVAEGRGNGHQSDTFLPQLQAAFPDPSLPSPTGVLCQDERGELPGHLT